MESSATEAARKKANALLAERAAIVKVGVDECLKCTVEVPSEYVISATSQRLCATEATAPLALHSGFQR